MTTWQKIKNCLFFLWILAITSTTFEAHAKWFDDIHDTESLEKYCVAKAQAYTARAMAFDEGSWPQQQYARLSGLWVSLPGLFTTPEMDLVQAHNEKLAEDLKAERTRGEGNNSPRIFHEEKMPISKRSVINATIDDILVLKRHIHHQKKDCPFLLKTEALTDDYKDAKAAQYQALAQATCFDKELSSWYAKLSHAWVRLDLYEIAVVKNEITKLKSQRSPFEVDAHESLRYPFIYRPFAFSNPVQNLALLPDRIPSPHLSGVVSLNFPGIVKIVKGSHLSERELDPLALEEIEIPDPSETCIRAGKLCLDSADLLTSKIRSRLPWHLRFHTLNIEMWQNHLFFRDLFSSTLGLTSDQACQVIETLVI